MIRYEDDKLIFYADCSQPEGWCVIISSVASLPPPLPPSSPPPAQHDPQILAPSAAGAPTSAGRPPRLPP